MPRPLSGRIIERRLHDERIAFDVVIRRRQVLVGYSPQWTRQRVAFLLSDQLLPRAKLREPWWEAIPSALVSEPATEPEAVSVREAASEYVGRLRSRYTNRATLNAYTSPVMKHVGPFFAYDGERERRVDEISGALVSSFTATKIAERDLLTNLAATLAELDDADLRDPGRLRAQLDSEAEWELLVRYGQRRGRLPLAEALGPEHTGRISLSSRGLSKNEINRCLARLRDIIDLAREEFGVDIGDPTRRRGLPRTDPPASWLLPFQLQAIFDAADERDRRRGGRLHEGPTVQMRPLNERDAPGHHKPLRPEAEHRCSRSDARNTRPHHGHARTTRRRSPWQTTRGFISRARRRKRVRNTYRLR